MAETSPGRNVPTRSRTLSTKRQMHGRRSFWQKPSAPQSKKGYLRSLAVKLTFTWTGKKSRQLFLPTQNCLPMREPCRWSDWKSAHWPHGRRQSLRRLRRMPRSITLMCSSRKERIFWRLPRSGLSGKKLRSCTMRPTGRNIWKCRSGIPGIIMICTAWLWPR